MKFAYEDNEEKGLSLLVGKVFSINQAPVSDQV